MPYTVFCWSAFSNYVSSNAFAFVFSLKFGTNHLQWIYANHGPTSWKGIYWYILQHHLYETKRHRSALIDLLFNVTKRQRWQLISVKRFTQTDELQLKLDSLRTPFTLALLFNTVYSIITFSKDGRQALILVTMRLSTVSHKCIRLKDAMSVSFDQSCCSYFLTIHKQ